MVGVLVPGRGVSDPDRAVGTGGARPAGPTVRWRARRRRCTSKGPLPTDELGLVQGVQGFCQGACVGVCLGPHRGHRLAVGQGLPIADGAVLDSAVASGGSGPLGSAPSLWRCQIPMFRASRARSVYRLVKVVCRPTIRREFTSVTKATYTHPDNVRTPEGAPPACGGMSANHSLFKAQGREVTACQVRDPLLTRCAARRAGRPGPTDALSAPWSA